MCGKDSVIYAQKIEYLIVCICTYELNSMWAFFQSLDYDNIENQLFLEEERRMSHMVNWSDITSIFKIRPEYFYIV